MVALYARSMSLSKRLFLDSFSAPHFQASRHYGRTAVSLLPMKPGTVLKSLAVLKGQDPPVTLPRADYPAWLGDLVKPMPSLATLRRVSNEEAQDAEIVRYLKLNRRKRIQQRNEQASV